MEPINIQPTPQPTRGQRVLRYLLYSITCVALLVGVLFLFWVLQSPTVLKVDPSKQFTVRPPVVSQNDTIYVHVNYCKTTDVKGSLVVRLVGKRSIIRLPYSTDDQRKGCVDREIPIPIPAYATDDTYYFEFVVTYQVNPIKTQNVTMRSVDFTVKAR